MIAALLALAAGVCLLVGFLAGVHVLGWLALAVAVVAVVLVLLPTRGGIVVEALVAEPVEEPEPEPPVAAPPVVDLDRLDPRSTAETPATDPLPAPPSVEPVETPTDDLVLVIPGRRRFHRPGCELLADHDVEKLTEEEAREEEFTPCTRCVN